MLKRIALSLALGALLCGFAGCSGCGGHTADINQATKVVDAWVKLIDQGNYDEAWDQTGPQFKKIVSKDNWVKWVAAYCRALGPVSTRILEKASYTGKIPSLPPGQYVLFKYATSFKNKPNSHEEITAQKEDDGVWRSLGYYVR